MDHRGLSRPVIPGSTPAPGPKGFKSVYSSRVAPHMMNQQGGQLPPPQTSQDANDIMAPPMRSPLQKEISSSRPFSSPSGEEPDRSRGLSPLQDGMNEDITSALSSGNSLTSSQQRKLQANTDRLNQRLMQQKIMTKIVAKLPFQLRESVSAVLTMAFSASENIQKDLDVSHQEVMALRAELFKRSNEVSGLRKTCAIYQEQLRGLRENVESLKDNVEARQKFTIKNRSAMTRLAATNRMLIDALDALQNNNSGNANQVTIQQMLTTPKTMLMPEGGLMFPSTSQSQSTSTMTPQGAKYPPKTHQLQPLQANTTATTTAPKTRALSAGPGALDILARSSSQGKLDIGGGSPGDETMLLQKQYEEKQKQMTMSQNDKLRESLLKIAREHYRSLKTSEHLQGKVYELSAALKRQEHISRKLQTELEEYKRANDLASPFSVSDGSGAGGHNNGNNPTRPSMKFSTAAIVAVAASRIPSKDSSSLHPKTQFSASTSIARSLRSQNPPRDRLTILDERFAQLVARGMIDPTEAVMCLRRIIQRVVHCGNHLIASSSSVPATSAVKNTHKNTAAAAQAGSNNAAGNSPLHASASVNVSLSLRDMIRDIADRDTANVFRTDVVNLYLLRPSVETSATGGSAPGQQKIRYSMQKFSSCATAQVPAGHPEQFDDLGEDLRASKSLAVQTMRTGKAMRLNIITMNSLFDKNIDGAGSAVPAKRLLAVPLFATSDVQHLHGVSVGVKDVGSNHVQDMPAALGALVFINRHASLPSTTAATSAGVGGNADLDHAVTAPVVSTATTIMDNEPFSEVDEVLALIFAQMISLLLMNSVKYDALFHHSQLLRSLLQSGPDLLHSTLHDTDLDTSTFSMASVPPNNSNNNNNNNNNSSSSSSSHNNSSMSLPSHIDTSSAVATAARKHEPVIASAQAQAQLLALLSSVSPSEVLVAMEDMAMEVLQCPVARAYLVAPTTNVQSVLKANAMASQDGHRQDMSTEALEQLYAYNYYHALTNAEKGNVEHITRFEWLYLDPQNQRRGLGATALLRTHPKRLRTARAPLSIGLLGQGLCPKLTTQQTNATAKQLPQSVLIPNALTSLEFDPELDIDSALLGSRPLLLIPLIDTSDEVGRVYGALEIIPPLLPSPRFNNAVSPNGQHDDFRLLFTQAADWLAHQFTSSALPLLFRRLGFTPSMSSIPISMFSASREQLAALEMMEDHVQQGQLSSSSSTTTSKRAKNLSFSAPTSPDARATTPQSQPSGSLSRAPSNHQLARPIATPTRISRGSNAHDSSTNAYYSRSASFNFIAGATTEFDIEAANAHEVEAMQEAAALKNAEQIQQQHHQHHHHHAQHEFLVTAVKKLEQDKAQDTTLKTAMQEEIERLKDEIQRLKQPPASTTHPTSNVETHVDNARQLDAFAAEKAELQAQFAAQLNELQTLLEEESNARSELYHQHATLVTQHHQQQARLVHLQEAVVREQVQGHQRTQEAVASMQAHIAQLQQEVTSLSAMKRVLESSATMTSATGDTIVEHGKASSALASGGNATHHGLRSGTNSSSTSRRSSRDHLHNHLLSPTNNNNSHKDSEATTSKFAHQMQHQQQLLQEKDEQFEHAQAHWNEEIRQRDQIIEAMQAQIQQLSQRTLRDIDSALKTDAASKTTTTTTSQKMRSENNTSQRQRAAHATDAAIPATIVEEEVGTTTSALASASALASQQTPTGIAGAEEDFAHVWYKLFDASQAAWYYCHALSGETSWAIPDDPLIKIIEQTADLPASQELDGNEEEETAATAAVAEMTMKTATTGVLPEHWEERMDESSQQVYYLNVVTGESSWTVPQASDAAQHRDNENNNGGDDDEDDEDGDEAGKMRDQQGGGEDDIFATNMSQWSAAAGDYTIDL